MTEKIYIKMLDVQPQYGGKGWVYIEFTDKLASRQIGVYPEKVLFSTSDNFLTDQPLDESETDPPDGAPIYQIGKKEFEEIWDTHNPEFADSR